MQEFIRRENIALFKKRLADPQITEPERGVLAGLLAEEMKGQGRKLAPADIGCGVAPFNHVAPVAIRGRVFGSESPYVLQQ